jgi:hypothetical protein
MSTKGFQAALRLRERAIGAVPGVNVLAVVNARLVADGQLPTPDVEKVEMLKRAGGALANGRRVGGDR